jgi:uncharacterized protein with HEPN domain
MSRVQFLDDERTKYAVVYCLLIIGEVARALADETREELSDISWAAMRGMRNRIVHEYFAMEWDVVANEIRPLIEVLKQHVPPPGEQ